MTSGSNNFNDFPENQLTNVVQFKEYCLSVCCYFFRSRPIIFLPKFLWIHLGPRDFGAHSSLNRLNTCVGFYATVNWFTCVAIGLCTMFVGSVSDEQAADTRGPTVCDTVLVTSRRSSVSPGPGRVGGGPAPWHGDRGPTRGAVAAVSPDGGV